jgi:hypothetical protein
MVSQQMQLKSVHRYCILFAAMAFLLLAGYLPCVVHADSSSAVTALASSETELLSDFNAAKAAEASGANISELTNSLNVASTLLSKAELAYSAGDYSSAERLAIQSQNVLSPFVSTANSLQNEAAQKQSADFLWSFVGSIVGAVVMLVGGFVVWVRLTRKDNRRGVMKV